MSLKQESAATFALASQYRSILSGYGAPADQDNMHRFMNVADALVTCQVAPGQRRLRLSHLPERSVALNIAVSCGIASFFVFYFGLLLVFFTVRAHVCSFWGGNFKPEREVESPRSHVVHHCSMPSSVSAAQGSTGNLQPQWLHLSPGRACRGAMCLSPTMVWTASLWRFAMLLTCLCLLLKASTASYRRCSCSPS